MVGMVSERKTHLLQPAGFAIPLLILCICLTSCAGRRNALEQETLERMEPVTQWLADFFMTRSYYPETIEELLWWKGEPLPDNPYTGNPMIDLGTKEFDPARSPGNFHYVPLKRQEQNLGYQIFVFGDRGLVMIIDQTMGREEIIGSRRSRY